MPVQILLTLIATLLASNFTLHNAVESDLRSAFLERPNALGVSSHGPKEYAILKKHFAAVLSLLDKNTDVALTIAVQRAVESNCTLRGSEPVLYKILKNRRQHQLERLAMYRELGKFPRNISTQGRVPVFVDDRSIPCAVAFLMLCDDQLNHVIDIAHAANDINIGRRSHKAIAHWCKYSGLLEEEAALIQPAYGFEDDTAPNINILPTLPPYLRTWRTKFQVVIETSELKADSFIELSKIGFVPTGITFTDGHWWTVLTDMNVLGDYPTWHKSYTPYNLRINKKYEAAEIAEQWKNGKAIACQGGKPGFGGILSYAAVFTYTPREQFISADAIFPVSSVESAIESGYSVRDLDWCGGNWYVLFEKSDVISNQRIKPQTGKYPAIWVQNEIESGRHITNVVYQNGEWMVASADVKGEYEKPRVTGRSTPHELLRVIKEKGYVIGDLGVSPSHASASIVR
jgi:hypothetical protein